MLISPLSSLRSEESRLFSEEVQGNMRRLLIEAIANNQKENVLLTNILGNNNNTSSSSSSSSGCNITVNSSSDGSVSPISGSETSSPEKQLNGSGVDGVASTSELGSSSTATTLTTTSTTSTSESASNALVDSAAKIVDAFMSNLAKKRASGEKPLGPLEGEWREIVDVVLVTIVVFNVVFCFVTWH